jgi:glycine cleavage system H protein
MLRFLDPIRLVRMVIEIGELEKSHENVCKDPIQLAWMVNEILRLDFACLSLCQTLIIKEYDVSQRNPERLLYAKTHEWVDVVEQGGQKMATLGITSFALEALTDLVYIELPKVGRQLKAGEPFGEIESVKAVSDLYSPVEGEVVKVHEGLGDKLETLHADPYGEGWLVEVKLSDASALSKLMDLAAYQKQCAEEQH